MTVDSLVAQIKPTLMDPCLFASQIANLTLRNYQQQVARSICDSICQRQGLSIVVMFPRQSGKNELQAQIEAYILAILSQVGAEIIKVSPTWKPQSLNAMRRLERTLEKNILIKRLWKKESGYIYRLDSARIFFLSGSPEANIVGATASTLLEVDEAQDVQISKYDKDIAPMAASTNATRVFWGTAWTSNTLLARELRAAKQAQQLDGIQRVFVLTADQVAAEVPAYGKFVAEQIQKLGRNHPMVKTQFFSEEIDAEGGFFPSARQILMHGSHPRQISQIQARNYVLLIDVAGQDETATDPLAAAAQETKSTRDSTTATIIEIDYSTCEDELIKAPTYRVVNRYLWTGAAHVQLYSQLKSLAEAWNVKNLVIDATGIGAGLAAFLDRALPGKVTKFTFNTSTKSKLGWDFLALCDTGRFKDYVQTPGDSLQSLFWLQVNACQATVYPGPDRRLSWSVPETARDPSTGELIHDDLLLSAALVAVLDPILTGPSAPTFIIQPADPLDELDQGF